MVSRDIAISKNWIQVILALMCIPKLGFLWWFSDIKD
jgi:hypothetical protein